MAATPDPDAFRPIKRRRLITTSHPDDSDLIPGLPDHVAHLCLSSIPPSLLYSVSKSWRRLLLLTSSPPPYLSLYALLSPLQSDAKSVEFFSFDPIASSWTPLPPRPPSIRFTLQHKSFLSLNLPVQSVTVNGRLVVVAATDPVLRPALDSPLIFDPAKGAWSYGPEMAYPRRWCAAGSLGGDLYVASGVGSQFRTSVARSVERLSFADDDDHHGRWGRMRGMRDGRLSREAVEAVGCRGRLYMVNVKGNAAKQGFVYDAARDEWGEMKEGMLRGWRGPASAMDEEEIYAVDERRGALMRYEWEMDGWCEVVVDELLKGAEHMAAAGGRVCVVAGDGGIVVVDVVCRTPKIWVVETPVGLRANSVHVLPRMLPVS